MKYLDEPRLAYWSNFLGSVELGDRLLSVRTDAFSCKKAGDDKRLSKELERHMKEKVSASLSSSPPEATATNTLSRVVRSSSTSSSTSTSAYGTSPSFGASLADVGVRRTLVDLICTMNASFPDYDFSGVRPDHFDKEASVSLVRNKVNAALAEISVIHNKIFLESFWADLDEVMQLKDCEVYSYSPDMEGDPFTEGCLWSFNHFFLNKSLKRVLFLHCTTKSKLHVMEDSMGMGSDSDADDDDEADLEDGDRDGDRDGDGENDQENDAENDAENCPGYIMGDMDMEPAGGDDDSMT